MVKKRWGFPKCGVQCANFYAKCPMTPKSRRWPICMRRRRRRKRSNGRSGKYPSTICLFRWPLRSVVDCHLGPENTSLFPDFALHLSYSFKKYVTSYLYLHDNCPWPKGRGQILFRGFFLLKTILQNWQLRKFDPWKMSPKRAKIGVLEWLQMEKGLNLTLKCTKLY